MGIRITNENAINILNEGYQKYVETDDVSYMKSAVRSARRYFERQEPEPQNAVEYTERKLAQIRGGGFTPRYHLVPLRYKDKNGNPYWELDYAPEMYDD